MKIYGAGPKTLAENLDVDLETAQLLSDSFNKTFPGVQSYQYETQGEISLKGYTTNLYDRRYYIENENNAYKVNNYRIQGRQLNCPYLSNTITQWCVERC